MLLNNKFHLYIVCKYLLTIIIFSKFPSAILYLRSSSTIPHVEKNLSDSQDLTTSYFALYNNTVKLFSDIK